MIQLFDVYSQESQDLHYSLTEAGLSDLAVVIEPDGFLPSDKKRKQLLTFHCLPKQNVSLKNIRIIQPV